MYIRLGNYDTFDILLKDRKEKLKEVRKSGLLLLMCIIVTISL